MTQYWTGTAWSSTDTSLTRRTNTAWVRNTSLPGGTDLPPGAYSILAQSIDRFSNYSSPVVSNFNIVSNTAPSASGQNVEVPYNTATNITLAATDAEGDAITYAVTGQPAHGTLTGTAPNLTYTPAANYSGPDSFTFTASDYALTGAAATVFINVGSEANTAPVAAAQQLTTAYNTALPITLSATDAQTDAITYNVATQPSHGTLTGTAPNLTYTPTTGYSGADSFTFTGSDFQLTGAAATISITVSPRPNTAPVAAGQTLGTAFNSPLAVTLSATDAENDAITYEVVTQPAHGTLTGTAPNLTYTPAANYSGADSFTFRGNDFGLQGDVATVSIEVKQPLLDLLIQDAAGNWLGANNLTSDATGQTVTSIGRAGRAIQRTIRIDTHGTQEQIDNWEWMSYQLLGEPAPAGWTVRYLINGWDITGSMLEEGGYYDGLPYGESSYLTVELTPSGGVASETVAVKVSATPLDDNWNPAPTLADAGKVQHTAEATAQPDISIRRMAEPDGTFCTEPLIGVGLSSQGVASDLSLSTTTDLTQRFEVSLKNLGPDTRTMQLQIPAPPANWNATLYYGVDAEFEGGTALTPVEQSGWLVFTVPDQVASMASASMRLETSMGTGTPLGTNYFCTLKSLGAPAAGNLPQEEDQVLVKQYAAHIEKVMYSFDGQTWSEVGAEPIITVQNGTILFKAVTVGGAGWPDRPVKLPIWSWNENKFYGDTIALCFDRPTPELGYEELSVSCGNFRIVKIRVAENDN